MAGALDGIRVLDLSRVLAGPYCSMILGDLGADVIKVERPGVGDETRSWGPPFAAPGESAYFISTNRNKRSITVNLKTPEGVAIIKDLARKSDVFLENFPPGTTEKLGIDYGVVRDVNPRIIYCSITGFGPDGPYKNRTGYDVVASALGGLVGITGEPDGPPVKVGVAITDVCTGLSAHGAICAALYAREKTGEGQHISLSLLETQVAALVNMGSSYLISGEIPQRWGTAHESIVPYQGFQVRDKYIIIAAGNNKLWGKLCDLLGAPELIEDPRFASNPLRVENRKECIDRLTSLLQAKTAEEWVEILNADGVPCAPINTMDAVFSDPQVLHRNMLVELDHPSAGKIKMAGIPVKSSATNATIRRPPPRLGEHTDEILTDCLEFDQLRLDDYREKGII
jgi:crotonobetainyl-CoA:carnitine CoA-transferase CaiB-like acyl-CoA transferase